MLMLIITESIVIVSMTEEDPELEDQDLEDKCFL